MKPHPAWCHWLPCNIPFNHRCLATTREAAFESSMTFRSENVWPSCEACFVMNFNHNATSNGLISIPIKGETHTGFIDTCIHRSMKHLRVGSLEIQLWMLRHDEWVICMQNLCIEWSFLFPWGTLRFLQKAIHEVQCFVWDNKRFAYQNDVVTERTRHKWQIHTKQTCYIHV